MQNFLNKPIVTFYSYVKNSNSIDIQRDILFHLGTYSGKKAKKMFKRIVKQTQNPIYHFKSLISE